MTFYEEFHQRLNAKYTVVTAEPIRRAELIHHLTEDSKNQEMVEWLRNKKFESIAKIGDGELRLYETALLLLQQDRIHFLQTFQTTEFNGKKAALLEPLWRDESVKNLRFKGLPLSAFGLFEVLLARYEVIILGEEHTPSGERWATTQMTEALKRGLHVYFTNEHGALFHAKTWEEAKSRLDILWGLAENYRKRLVIVSKDLL